MPSENRLRVGVIFGGRSGEHAVSLMSARSVLDALDPSRYEVIQIGVALDGTWLVGEGVLEALERSRTAELHPATLLPHASRADLFRIENGEAGLTLHPFSSLDVVFPVLHGPFGEDGTLQGLLEMAGLAYVGAGVLGSALGMDKGVFKDVMRAHGIPVLDWLVLDRKGLQQDLEGLSARAEGVAPYPLFTKPANLGSSVGVTKCRGRADLVEGLLEAAQYDRRVVVERGIDAREIEVSVLGNAQPEVSIPGEIRPAAEFYTYEAKYHDDRSELLIPAPLSEALTEQVRTYARQAYLAVDGAGMARVDFLLDRDTDTLYLNELNTIPGFTRISMYPKLWEASGLPYPALMDRLIELALERHEERNQTVWQYRRGN